LVECYPTMPITAAPSGIILVYPFISCSNFPFMKVSKTNKLIVSVNI
jgi:hypothetical protein